MSLNRNQGLAISGLAVVVAATLAMTGCTSGSQATNEKVVLKVAGTSDTQAFEKILLDYTKSHPNVKIQSTFVPTDQYTTTTRTQLGANNGADVFLVFPGSGNTMSVGPLAKAGAISDLSDQPWVAQFHGEWHPCRAGGDGGAGPPASVPRAGS